MTTQRQANLRVRSSCEWIYKESLKESEYGCPKCEFGASYGARHVYGDKCYRYQHNQKPWYDNKMMDYSIKLLEEIKWKVAQ